MALQLWALLLLIAQLTLAEKSFKINCEENRFELDGKPFRYIAGEVHYFRIPRALWKDRLERIRAIGVNVLQTYVAWNFHEDTPGVYDFTGDRDVRAFIKLAESLGFLVNLRLGPYICAEWEQGGLPWWLLGLDNIDIRTNAEPYYSHAKRWVKRIATELGDLQYPDGPVLMVQLENEYGSYGNNHAYIDGLFEYGIAQGLNKSVLFTTDGNADYWLKGGVSKYAYPTVDFGGQNSFENVKNSFDVQRQYSKCGPAVNSEFYPGWFASWFQSTPVYTSTDDILKTMRWMYQLNASFSFYMIHGGTNWGFWNGAEVDSYITTTYDYGSPLDEAAQITPKYLRIREFIKDLAGFDFPDLPIPKNHSTFAANGLPAERLAISLPEALKRVSRNCKNVEQPDTFEKFGQGYGYAIYEHEPVEPLPQSLSINFFRDLVYVFIGDEYQGVFGGCNITFCTQTTVKLNSSAKGNLILVAENLGRLNFNHGLDKKGIRSPVLGDGKVITNWTQCGVNHDKLSELAKSLPRADDDEERPGLYISKFKVDIPDVEPGVHTYIDLWKFGKGQLWLNGVNIGRYWPDAGPLSTLYAPATFFEVNNKKDNNLVLLNFAPRPRQLTFDFVDAHQWK